MRLSRLFIAFSFFGFALAADAEDYVVSFKDGVLAPSQVQVKAGQEFTLTVQNDGWTTEEFESRDLNIEKMIPPSKKKTFKVGPLKAGTYTFYGDFHENTTHGTMVATP